MSCQKAHPSERRDYSKPVNSRECESVKTEREKYDAGDIERPCITKHLSFVGEQRNRKESKRMVKLIPHSRFENSCHLG